MPSDDHFENGIPEHTLILASASPRRSELLRLVGVEFAVCPADVDETVAESLPPGDIVRQLSQRKASVLAERYPRHWILAADTIVVCDGDVLGKPANAQMACEMLMTLQGRAHEVWSGFCVMHALKQVCVTQACESRVHIAQLSEQDVRDYVRTGEPMDKAGAYAIQGIGIAFVERIEGSYSSVVGLPVAEVLATLVELAAVPSRLGGLGQSSKIMSGKPGYFSKLDG